MRVNKKTIFLSGVLFLLVLGAVGPFPSAWRPGTGVTFTTNGSIVTISSSGGGASLINASYTNASFYQIGNTSSVTVLSKTGVATNRFQVLNTNNQAVVFVDSNSVLNASNILTSGSGTNGMDNLVVTNFLYMGNARVGGTLTNALTAIISSGTAETNLLTFSIPANLLTNNGDRIVIKAGGRVGTTGTKRVDYYYGSVAVLSHTSLGAGESWTSEVTISRTGNTAQRVSAWLQNGFLATAASTNNVMETLQTNGIATLFRITGTSTTSSMITNNYLSVDYYPAP